MEWFFLRWSGLRCLLLCRFLFHLLIPSFLNTNPDDLADFPFFILLIESLTISLSIKQGIPLYLLDCICFRQTMFSDKLCAQKFLMLILTSFTFIAYRHYNIIIPCPSFSNNILINPFCNLKYLVCLILSPPNIYVWHYLSLLHTAPDKQLSQSTITCSKLTVETLEQGVKYVYSNSRQMAWFWCLYC